ncbi:MAG: ArsB/NhaD family transporter [Gammaproteobacteria bacterium]
MVTEGTETARLFLGMDPAWFAGVLFVMTYVVIMTDRLNRAIVSLMAAGLMIAAGLLNQEAALHGIDFNTIGLLTGMMIIVTITKKSGIFQYLAIWSAKKVGAKPWGILVMLAVVTAVLSALLPNVTTVLMIAPVTLLITDALKVNPYPYLFAQLFAANIGGTATLIGDPPNIMIGSAANLTFNDFLVNLGPLVVVIFMATLLPIYLIWGRTLTSTPERRQRVLDYRESDALTDKRLLWQSLSVLAVVITGFALADVLHVEVATVAMFGASLLLLLDNLPRRPGEQNKVVEQTFAEIEWQTIFFFIGLFILVYGLGTTGLMEDVAHDLLELTGGDTTVTAISLLWASAVASAFVDNIPYVATMIPLIKNMSASLGGPQALVPIWWSLSLGACLGGNGTLVGSSSNLIIVSFAERTGHPIRFMPFLLMAFPLMLLSLLISTVYVYLRYL